MSSEGRFVRSLWLLLPSPARRVPADIAAVFGLTAATWVTILAPVVNETPLRILFGLIFVLFLPGYAFIAALFPEAGSSPATVDERTQTEHGADTAPDTREKITSDTTDAETTAESTQSSFGGFGFQDRGIDGIERVALSFGLSIAVVPLIGLLLNFTPWGIRLLPILVGVSGFTLGTAVIAVIRRRSLPPGERFYVPYRRWINRGRNEIFNPETRLDGILNVLLAVSILLAVGSVGYAVMVPPQGEQFTEFYILTEDDDDLVAANYPTEFRLGEGQPVTVGIGNNEHEELSYTVVVQLQQVETQGNQTEVIEREEIDRFSSPELSHNETWHTERDIVPTISGEDLRVQLLLYPGDEVPANPTSEDAYRDIHLWIDVER